MSRPGAWLRRMALRICDAGTMTRVIDPILADLQWEDAQAAPRGPLLRQYVRGRARVAFWRALTVRVWQVGFGRLRPNAVPEASLIELAVTAAAMTLVMTAFLVGPPFMAFMDSFRLAKPLEKLSLTLYLIPQAAVLTLPAGLMMGALVALTGRSLSRRILVAITGMAFGCSLMAVVMVEWGVPSANQAFRELTFSLVASSRGEQLDPPRRGVSEVRWSELPTLIENAEDQQLTQLSRRLQFDYHMRVALTTMPIALALLAVNMSTRMRRRLVATAVGLLVCAGVLFTLYSGRSASYRGLLSPVAGAWAPVLTIALAAFALWAKPVSTLRAKLSKHPAA